VGSARLIGETGDAERVIAGEELVARLPADPVGGTELGDGDHPTQGVTNELVAKLHGDHLLPRHRTLLEEPETWP
jgi:hypothetical protein